MTLWRHVLATWKFSCVRHDSDTLRQLACKTGHGQPGDERSFRCLANEPLASLCREGLINAGTLAVRALANKSRSMITCASAGSGPRYKGTPCCRQGGRGLHETLPIAGNCRLVARHGRIVMLDFFRTETSTETLTSLCTPFSQGIRKEGVIINEHLHMMSSSCDNSNVYQNQKHDSDGNQSNNNNDNNNNNNTGLGATCNNKPVNGINLP